MNEATGYGEVRILHFGDVLFGSPFLTPAPEKSAERRRIQRETFDRTLQTIRDQKVQLAVITGDLFDEDDLMYIANLSQKVTRLREDVDSLSSSLVHVQDAYSSYLDIKLNNTMKLFTVLTSIFFPLTIIVGWYGMNFQSMPEFTWKYGYLYVIALSIVTVWVLISIGRRKKWF